MDQFPAGLVVGSGGVIYGTTEFGGSFNGYQCGTTPCGTVFSLTPPSSPGAAWTKTTIYDFQGNSDGFLPHRAFSYRQERRALRNHYHWRPRTWPGVACLMAVALRILACPAFPVPAAHGRKRYSTPSPLSEEGTNPQAGVVMGFVMESSMGLPTTVESILAVTAEVRFSLCTRLLRPEARGPSGRYTPFKTPPIDGSNPAAPLSIGKGGVPLWEHRGRRSGMRVLWRRLLLPTPPASPGGKWTEAVLHTFPSYAPRRYLARHRGSCGPGGTDLRNHAPGRKWPPTAARPAMWMAAGRCFR